MRQLLLTAMAGPALAVQRTHSAAGSPCLSVSVSREPFILLPTPQKKKNRANASVGLKINAEKRCTANVWLLSGARGTRLRRGVPYRDEDLRTYAYSMLPYFWVNGSAALWRPRRRRCLPDERKRTRYFLSQAVGVDVAV